MVRSFEQICDYVQMVIQGRWLGAWTRLSSICLHRDANGSAMPGSKLAPCLRVLLPTAIHDQRSSTLKVCVYRLFTENILILMPCRLCACCVKESVRTGNVAHSPGPAWIPKTTSNSEKAVSAKLNSLSSYRNSSGAEECLRCSNGVYWRRCKPNSARALCPSELASNWLMPTVF